MLSKTPIGAPTSERNDIVVAMFQAAFDSHKHEIKKGGAFFVDSGLVPDVGDVDSSVIVWKVLATETAIRLGSKMAGNMVMLGFFHEKTKAVSKESMVEAIRESMKEKYVAMNLAAFKEGARLAREAAAP